MGWRTGSVGIALYTCAAIPVMELLSTAYSARRCHNLHISGFRAYAPLPRVTVAAN